MQDPPCIYILYTPKESEKTTISKILLFNIASAICEQERIGVRQDEKGRWYPLIQDVDELPQILELYEIYEKNKQELDKLSEDEKITRILQLHTEQIK
jgi:hypothetical protein